MDRRCRSGLRAGLGLIAWTTAAAVASAGSVVIHVAGEVPVASATLVAATAKDAAPVTGVVHGDTVTFADLHAGIAYNATLTLADHTVLQGVDLSWYSRVPDKPNAEPLTDDDREQMAAVRTKILSFFNRADELFVRGNHNRAVMMVDLRRDSAFHSDSGGEVIWRPEIWYFENHHGGWEKVQQTDRDVRRERFHDAAAYHAAVDPLRWVPELGGLKLTPAKPDLTVTVPNPAGQPATRPAS